MVRNLERDSDSRAHACDDRKEASDDNRTSPAAEWGSHSSPGVSNFASDHVMLPDEYNGRGSK